MSKKNQGVSPDGGSGKFMDYVWANAIFFGFLILLSVLVSRSCEAPSDDLNVKHVLHEAQMFIVYLFGGGFLAVTLLDAAYDFFAVKAEAPSEPAKSA